ncbi:cytoskeleton-associated protein 5-like [Mizuhopecten yessoensis]|uniref:Cytoskeleton-associated protein 5 n=1 Tax=Mizuhopecten yessoensis TaxID=6573 RepID=A0A210Q2J6_MIZYE|nr:cytoskeleton-associated protein 5-like [Mizuhopecten yessoensis]OWF42942.1 Cytoskeleton-associated protein 5 [Mizuhopecten yessoensis]
MGDDSEWMKLPTEEKCTHKVWRARLTGYEEVTKLFRSITDEKSSEFSKYAGLMKKFVIDSNAVAQEKALDAVLVFIENAAVANKTAGEVVSAVVAKCLNASKQKTREKGIEIIMLYIEIEKQDVVQECLIQGLENKQPKIVVGCIQCLTMALRDFSNKVMPIKPLMKFLPKLLEDRDKNVREETKLLVIEIHRWIGPALKPMMNNFKPVQVTELEAEFERQPKEKPHQQRFMRSQQDLKAKMEEQAAAGGGDGEEDDGDEGEDAVDAYEMMPEVDILSQLPKDYYDKVEAKKWQDRREVLEALQKLTENPRLSNGDYGYLVKTLIKVVGKDSNVMLVSLGAKCMAGIAKGLRKKYAPYASNTIQVILEKFKEKKQMVVVQLRDAADAAYMSTTLDAISEDMAAALDNKNPSIKAETAYLLARCFAKSTLSTLPKKLLKQFCTCLLKTANDTTPEVRERSYEALGMAMKVVSEKHIAPFLVDFDPIKMQKIQESCQAAVLLNIYGEPRGGAGAAAPKPKKEEPKPVQRPSTAPAKSGQSKPAGAKGGPPKKKAPAKATKGKDKKGGAAEGGNEFTENALSDEAVEEKATAVLSAETVAQLSSSNWKERLASMEKMSTTLKGLSKDDIPCQALLRTVCKKPGLKDTNFQVLKIRVETVGHLAKNTKFSRISAEYCLADLVDKIGDVKNGAAVKETLSCIAEAVSLDYVGREVMKLSSEQKNPKNSSECMNWLGNAIKEFGFKINAKALVALIKKAFGATNPAIRTSAINLVPVLYLYMGPTARVFFEDEKAALLQQIDAEIEKVKGEKAPAPTRGPVIPTGGDEEDDDDEEGGETEESNSTDLIPRNDVGEKFTPELMAEMADKNWKIRKESLEKVAAILNEAKFITANLGPLPESIKLRLGDSNKILVNMTIAICSTLATNMGPHCKHHIRVIGPALIGCFGDSKPALRAAAVGALNAWVDQCNLVPLVEVEAILDALRLENPNLRQELLGWLSEKLPNHKQLPPDFKQCVPLLLNCLEDRNSDIRKKAQEALVPFMIHVGYESLFKAAAKMKPGSKDTILALLEKARGNLPAKPQKAKKAAAPVKASTPESYDEPEPSKPSRPLSTASQDSVDSKPASKTVRGKAKGAPAPSKKKKEDEDLGPPMNTTVPKEQRFKDEKTMKVLKWNFIEVRGEYIEQLRTQMEKNFSKSMIDLLFHTDFKCHTKAIEILIKCLDTQHDATMVNLDIILKWFTIRFFDTNPSMLNKALEYLRLLFTMLVEEDYHLAEYEATSFIPYLIIKVGDSKDGVRRDVRVLFKLLHKVYPASKTFSYLIDGLKSKNSKQRMECLEELSSLIEAYGITICQPTPGQALKTISGQIGNRDNGVRNAALNATVVAHTILGDSLYKYTGVLNDKDQDLLDERIKRSLKNRSAQPQKAPEESRPKTAPQQPQRSASQATIQRPGTGIPKSASSNSVKKFAIEIEDDQTSQLEFPKLLQYDLEELFQPVKLPPTITRNRPPSPSLRMAKSTDAATTISMVISQITSADITLCIQALAQIDEVLKEEGRAEVMVNHVDQLLLSMSMQLKMVYSTHMGSKSTPKDNVIRLYRCLLGTLLALFQKPSLSSKASKDVLKDLINNLVTILLDNRLVELEEGAQVVRSVNVMVVKIVEKADQTSIMSALIRLLQDCVASEICSGKFLELIMKCLWKIVRMLPEIINDINLDSILLDIHVFMTAFPGSTWKSRPNDLPIRTMRTILHSISKLQGAAILNHMTMIDGNSEVRSYLNKILKVTGAQNGGMEEEDSRAQRGSAQKAKRLTKSTHDMLAVIFKKIGSKENTKEGLNDLYDFKKKYPDADLEPFLKKSSQFFQMYIERGLNSIEQEREGKHPTSDTGYTKSDIQVISNPSTSESTEEPNVYLQRLRVLRARCGLYNIEEPNNTNPSKPEPEVEAIPSQDTDTDMTGDAAPTSDDPPSSMTSADICELKMRLERIKRLANS